MKNRANAVLSARERADSFVPVRLMVVTPKTTHDHENAPSVLPDDRINLPTFPYTPNGQTELKFTAEK